MRGVVAVFALLLAAPACSYYGLQTMPADVYTASDLAGGAYRVGEPIRVSRYGFRLFTIPISVPDPLPMMAARIRQNHAVGLTDVDVDFSEFGGGGQLPLGWGGILEFLFQVPKVTVTARLVYKNDAAPPAAAPAECAPPAKAPPEKAPAEKTPDNP
jgi:hypothetical protein